jgi:anti-sigma B factor antagonist
MTLTRTDSGESTILRIEGSLDAVSTPELRAMIDSLVVERRPAIHIDLSALRLVDSSGVGALVSIYKRIRAQGGQVAVSGLRDQPLAIFRLLHLDRVLTSG